MRHLKSIIGSSIGNVMEWYDFGLFAVYSPLFSKLFFPTSSPQAGVIAIFSIFAAGFLCRPIGALLFGYLGDRQGRAKTLRLSILMISVPTLLIGCLPTFESAGLLAPILLTLIRLWQGISLGGEFSGNIIYLAEVAPQKRRGFFASLAGTGANIGILLATFVSLSTSYFFADKGFETWGWRIPYLLSGFICLFIYATRLQMNETKVFEYLKQKKLLVTNPISTVFKANIPQMARTAGLVCMGSTFYYTCFIYMPSFMTQNLHFTLAQAMRTITIYVAAMIVLVPLAGMLCDYVGRRKLFLFNSMFIMLIAIPGFYFMSSEYEWLVYLVLGIFTIASSLEQGTTAITVVENYPIPARYTGLSFGYNAGAAIFGGTAPLVCEWLISKTSSILAPAVYAVLCAFITGVIVLLFVPETRNKSLEN